MATQHNFRIKNGLEVAGTERISSAGVITGSLASATTATTQSAADNSTKIATTAYTDAAITALIGGAPSALNDLNELAAAIADDANYSTTITTALATKLPLAGGTMTGNITSNESTFSIFNNDFRLKTSAAETMLRAVGNGAVEIMHDNATKLATTSTGVTVTGTLTSTGYVGVGASPSSGLHLTGASNTASKLTLTNTAPSPDNTWSLHPIYNGQDLLLNEDSDTRVTFKSGGNVGIGTASPDEPLHIYGSGYQRLKIQATGSGNGADLQLKSKNDSTQWILFNDSDSGNNSGVIKYVHSTNKMHFRTNDIDDRLVIDASGNVGIGTSSPNAKLEVTGSSDGDLTSAIFANTVQGGTNDTVAVELQLAGSSGQVAASTLRAGKGEDWTSGTSRSGFLAIEAVLDGTNRQMAYFGSDGDGSSKVSFSTNNSERMRIDGSGALLVDRTSKPNVGEKVAVSREGIAIARGTSSGEYRLMYGNDSASMILYFSSGSNQAQLSAAGAWVDASDVAYKKDIVDINYGLDTVKKLKPRTYKMKPDDEQQIGFVAQELELDIPEIVNGEDGSKGVAYGQLTAVLTKAIQEQQELIKDLQTQINNLRGK